MDKEKYIVEAKMREEPKKPTLKFKLGDKCVKNKHLDDKSVDTRVLDDKSVTPDKLADDVKPYIVNDVDDKYKTIADNLDEKYTNITNELYSMVESLQVGGIALSQQFGNRTDIGISQKTLTKALGKFWDEMSTITGKTYMDFTLTVVPTTTYSETSVAITIKADCSDSISNFDSIKLYIDNVLIGESSDLEVYTKAYTIHKTSMVKAVGVILGKTITKEQQVVKEIPFFMGSGQNYQDVMNEKCRKQLVGTLEGDYDVQINNTGDYLFVIIPNSKKEEFRRCTMDMSGIEFQFTEEEHSRFLVCKSVNTYQAGTYNIDIDINS